MSNQFYKLKVIAIDNPIKDAATVTLEMPDHLGDEFKYHPGQHLIIKFKIDGEEARRSYSLNSCPFKEEELQITVKRVKGGLVSNYINDYLEPGSELEVMAPQGRFYADINKDAYKTYFLFAAGSGITPIISILKSVLIASMHSVVNLFYGNTDQDTIIFKKELDELQIQYPKRLKIVYILSDPKTWSTWEQWPGRNGRIEGSAVEWFIDNYPPIAQHTEYYICGPGAMNISVRDALLDLQIPKELIYIEQFGTNTNEANTKIDAFDNAQLTATLNGRTYDLIISKGKTILQTLKEANANPPYSCESGVCATCAAKITKGQIEMKSCMALSDKDMQDGVILTCQALPMTEEIEIDFERVL